MAGRKARVADVHAVAAGMPHATVDHGPLGKAVYQVGRKSFVLFRNPRPDATDPATGDRYDDVIVVWVPSEADKRPLVDDESTPYVSTSHFDRHPSVLLRCSRVGELSLQELTELSQDAWLTQASARREHPWLHAHPLPSRSEDAKT